MGRSSVAFVGLAYQVTLGQTVHAADDVADWLAESGFRNVDRASMGRARPGNVLLQAVRE